MSQQQCKECQYFLQHYAFNSRRIYRVYCGHCTYRKAKRKRPDTSACENFTPGPDDVEAFATKEFLSKELLSYILHLDLLPEIEDIPVPPVRKSKG